MRNWRQRAAAVMSTVLGCASFAVATPFTPVDAIGPTTGSVSGTIGPIDPIGSAQVQLLDATFNVVQSVGSAAGGSYSFADVVPGDYFVSTNLSIPGTMLAPPLFHPGSYDRSEAAPIHVVANEALTGIDITAPALGSISGHVNNVNGGVAFAQVNVRRPDGSYAASTQANSAGAYTVTNLLPGSYLLQTFAPDPILGSVEVYHPAATSIATATAVVVGTATVLTNIDIELPHPATIDGSVRDAGGNGIQGVTVYAVMPTVSPFPIAMATTDPAGHFHFASIPAGTDVLLSFLPPSSSNLMSEYYDDALDAASATRINLASGETRPIDVALAAGARLTGRVQTAAGVGVDGQVFAYDTARHTYTQSMISNGDYDLTSLLPGTYVIYAQPGLGSLTPSPYAPEYYGESYDYAGAQTITVAEGQAVIGLDVTVSIGATISGRVVDALGQPVRNASMEYTFAPAIPPSISLMAQGTVTGVDGRYEMIGLPPGTVSVVVRPETTTGLLLKTESRTTTLGSVASNVDYSLERGAFGTGTILTPTGPLATNSPFSAVVVCPVGAVWLPNNFMCDIRSDAGSVPNPDGTNWLVGPLAPGDYWVAAFTLSTGIGPQAPLTVVAGQSFSCALTTPGVTTPPECHTTAPFATGTISGRVTGPTGAGMAGVDVTADYTGSNGQDVSLLTKVTTDALGYYTMAGVVPGSYRVRFAPPQPSNGLSQQWWTADGATATSAIDADLVAVAVGQTVPGINVRMVLNGSGIAVITSGGVPAPRSTGTVAAACHAPAHYLGSFFSCDDHSSAFLAFYDSTAQHYVWQELPPGTYNVRAADVFNGPRLGAETSVDLFSGDAIDCTLPFESTATASCSVTHTLSDTDGVISAVEDAAPNGGDGNADGTPDALQPNVTSVADPTVAPGTTQADYITLAVEPTSNGGNSYGLSSVTVTDPPATAPAPPGATPQTGLVGFDVVDLPATGSPATVSLDVYLGSLANSYWKYDQVHGWRDFTSIATFAPTPVSVGGVDRWKVTLTITDNGFGDEDPAQGVISDPGVFAFVNPDSVPPGIVWNGGIANGQAFDFGLVPSTPTCSATDAGSGPAECTVTGYDQSVGTHVLTAVAHDVAGNETVQTRSYSVRPYTLAGFQKPVDMGGVWNTMKPGKTVSFRFEVFRGATELTSVAVVQSFRYTTVSCASGSTVEDPVEIVTTEDDGLAYETGPGEFRLKWKTPNKANACLKATLTTVDGSTLTALFKLK